MFDVTVDTHKVSFGNSKGSAINIHVEPEKNLIELNSNKKNEKKIELLDNKVEKEDPVDLIVKLNTISEPTSSHNKQQGLVDNKPSKKPKEQKKLVVENTSETISESEQNKIEKVVLNDTILNKPVNKETFQTANHPKKNLIQHQADVKEFDKPNDLKKKSFKKEIKQIEQPEPPKLKSKVIAENTSNSNTPPNTLQNRAKIKFHSNIPVSSPIASNQHNDSSNQQFVENDKQLHKSVKIPSIASKSTTLENPVELNEVIHNEAVNSNPQVEVKTLNKVIEKKNVAGDKHTEVLSSYKIKKIEEEKNAAKERDQQQAVKYPKLKNNISDLNSLNKPNDMADMTKPRLNQANTQKNPKPIGSEQMNAAWQYGLNPPKDSHSPRMYPPYGFPSYGYGAFNAPFFPPIQYPFNTPAGLYQMWMRSYLHSDPNGNLSNELPPFYFGENEASYGNKLKIQNLKSTQETLKNLKDLDSKEKNKEIKKTTRSTQELPAIVKRTQNESFNKGKKSIYQNAPQNLDFSLNDEYSDLKS